MSAPARRMPVSASSTAARSSSRPCGGGRLDHRVLAADVVGGDRQLGRLADAADHVEVGQRGLDHEHVGALVLVEPRLAHAPRGRWRDPSGSRGGRRRRARSRPPRGTARRRRRRTSRCRRRSASRTGRPRRARARIAPTRPSIMSLGATTSAPGLRPGRPRCGRAARASRRCRRRRPARSTPQWPWSCTRTGRRR